MTAHNSWKERFINRYWLPGPLFWSATIVFFAAQVVVAYEWRSRTANATGVYPYHAYSLFANAISDLGETAKYTYGNPPMWSPWAPLMNAALVFLGFSMILGAPIVYREFVGLSGIRRLGARFGFTAQGLAGVGAIVVALRPENTNKILHELGAGVAIALGTAGLLVLSYALPELPLPMRRFMQSYFPVALVAIVLFALHEYLGWGPGGMERIATYPEVIWLVLFARFVRRKRPLDFANTHGERSSETAA